MFQSKRRKRINLFVHSILAVAFLAPSLIFPVQAAQEDAFKLRVETGYIHPGKGPQLTRQEVKAADPFDVAGEEAFEAPDTAFQIENALPAAAPPPFALKAHRGAFSAEPMPGMESLVPTAASVPAQPTVQARINPGDPDSSGEMQLAWDRWHQRVAEAIYLKFNPLAKKGFSNVRRPMTVKAVYTVDRNMQVGNVMLTQKSPNMMYNLMVMGVIQSMNGNPILLFPPGSRRMTVQKTGTFLWNHNLYGYKYTTNDRETIRSH